MRSIVKNIFLAAAAAVFLCTPQIASADEKQTIISDNAPEIYEGETFDDGMVTYTKAKGGVYITSCSDSVSIININSEIDGYKILGIYDGAFKDCVNMNSINISDEIGYIGAGAFLNCISLTEIKLPSDLKTIPDYCFYGCSKLKNIDIPESVTSIGTYSFAYSGMGESLVLPEGIKTLSAMSYMCCENIKTVSLPSTLESIGSLSFIGCKALEAFEVSEENNYYKEIDGVLYSKDQTILERFPSENKTTDFSVPESVLYIQPGAFYDNKYIENITMTDKVQKIGEMAFSRCTELKSVYLSNKLTEIGTGLFCDCILLNNIDIPDSVTSIEEAAFLGCNLLRDITISDNVTTIGDQSLGFTDDMGTSEIKKTENFKIKANYESAAADYARKNNISIDYLDGNKKIPYIIAVSVAAIIVIAAVLIIVKKKKSKNVGEYNEESENDESSD